MEKLEPKPTLALGGYTDAQTNKHGVRILVTNAGEVVFNELKVEFVYEFVPPIARQTEGKPPLKFHDMGGSFQFGTAAGQEGPIRPGETRTYLYLASMMPLLKTLVQQLPGDQYHISLTINGGEQQPAILGPAFADFIERTFPEVETVDLDTALPNPK